MKTFIADIIPKIQMYSQKLDDLTRLTNQHWVSLGEISQIKRVFIFRPNNQLLISENGVVERGNWDYLGNQSLLIDIKEGCYLMKHGFFDDNVIALKLDSTNSYAFFVNETKYDQELNNLDDIVNFLNRKYLKDQSFKPEDTINIEDVIVPGVASTRGDKITFVDGIKTQVIKDFQGRYFIVTGYQRQYYKTHVEAIRASYIYKLTNKISKIGLEDAM